MSDCTKQLSTLLAEYDGKAISILGEIEAKLGDRHCYLDSLIDLATSKKDNVSNGATWLIKSALGQGLKLSTDQTYKLCENLSQLTEWPEQLHICQTFRFLVIPFEKSAAVSNWLRPLLTHKRPFLRAWSLDALWQLAVQHSDFEIEARNALIAAQKDEAASVRARARNLTVR